MGVISTSRLEAGEKFGPVPPTLTLAEPTTLIGHRTCDTLPDIHTVKVIRGLSVNFLHLRDSDSFRMNCEFAHQLSNILIHDLLFLPISTIEARVS